MQPQIEIKGLRDGVLITLGEGNWADLFSALFTHLDQQADFMRGARLALDVGNQILKAADMGQLVKEMTDREITLWAVLSNSPVTETTAQTLGLATRLSKPRPDLTSARVDTSLREGEPAIMIHRTLRSGYSVNYKGHVIVMGDVNPGAEIISSGSVLVWGRLRGLVHAGAEGDENAVVCALDLSPTQLRIAGCISITPQRKGRVQPEIAYLVNNQVVAEIWDSKKIKGKES